MSVRQVSFPATGDQVGAVGFGAMGLSWAYDRAGLTEKEKREVLRAAVDQGMDFIDTATLYGGGANEELVGAALHDRREEIFLCSKAVLFAEQLTPPKTGRNGRPEYLRQAIDDSLRRLRTDVIDLYYAHRLDSEVPLEDTWGALAEMVQAGKVRSIGMSEVTVEHLDRAQAIHPVAAVQSEYSLWSRDPDGSGTTSDGDPSGDVISWCRDHDAAFVPFSPVGRGYFSGRLTGRTFPGDDFRAGNPRFTPEARAANDQRILPIIDQVARRHGVTKATAAIAWSLLPERQGGSLITISGTSNREHLAENARAAELAQALDDEDIAALNGIPAPAQDRR